MLHKARGRREGKQLPPLSRTADLFDTGPRERLQCILDDYEDKKSQLTGA